RGHAGHRVSPHVLLTVPTSVVPKPYRNSLFSASLVTAPAMRWIFGLALHPDEIGALRAGKHVTSTYPEPLHNGPPPLLLEECAAVKGGKRVIKMTTSLPPPLLQVGDVVS